ncbi:MAG: type II toxin-antitoxin system RelE/ParE family toxin [Alphaproteobacteria bacterium]
MIRSFRDRRTQAFFEGRHVPQFRAFADQAARRLAMLDKARALSDLAAVPGNRLEALRGDRQGQHSIRINRQWRACFEWRSDGPYNVEIVDYHD